MLQNCFYHKVRADYIEVHKVLKKVHVLRKEIISQTALSFRYRKKESAPQSSVSPYFSSKEWQHLWHTHMQTLDFKHKQNSVTEGGRKDGSWGMKLHLNFFFLTFDYGNCWIWDKGNWPPLFSKVSFFGDLSCAADLWRGKGILFQLALWTMLTGLPPMQRHPPVTLNWHTLMSKPSLRLPSAGKPARIRKFQLPQLIRKTTFKSWREKGHVTNC